MPALRVEWSARAKKSLRRISNKDQEAIVEAVDEMAAGKTLDVKALAGRPGFRLRVGNYRVIFTKDGEALVIFVVDVGHRRDVYRRG